MEIHTPSTHQRRGRISRGRMREISVRNSERMAEVFPSFSAVKKTGGKQIEAHQQKCRRKNIRSADGHFRHRCGIFRKEEGNGPRQGEGNRKGEQRHPGDGFECGTGKALQLGEILRTKVMASAMARKGPAMLTAESASVPRKMDTKS